MENYLSKNSETYEHIYKEGWGNSYTDTLWVSIFHRVAKKYLKKKDNIKVLDFGCGVGANTRFFHNLGYEVYGIDISQTAIKRCIEINGFDSSHFKTLDLLHEKRTLEAVFGTKFDIVFASEVMYYFDDDGIRNITFKFNESMNDGAIFMCNMSTWNHPYYKQYKKEEKRAFVNVGNSGTIGSSLYVNVMNNKEDMEELFDIFECKKICVSSIETDEVSETIHYIGVKKSNDK